MYTLLPHSVKFVVARRLSTNTDDITSQSHSLFTCSCEQIRQVENQL